MQIYPSPVSFNSNNPGFFAGRVPSKRVLMAALLSVALLFSIANASVFAQQSGHLIAASSVYNNRGTSDDSSPATGSFDGVNSYSAEALQAVGIIPGGTVAFNGVNFVWPSPPVGAVNNYRARGQVIPVVPVDGATTLALLGAASGGNTSGTATITYSDRSIQTFTLGFSDWTLGSGHDTPAFGNLVVATTAYRNTPAGAQNLSQPMVFYTDVLLQAAGGKTVKSVTLPATVTGNWLHVFAVGSRAGLAPPMLQVSPTHFTDVFEAAPCTYNIYGGDGPYGGCPITLTNSSSMQSLPWSARTSSTDYSLDVTSGTLAPGQSTTVNFSGLPIPCPGLGIITFTGANNTVEVPIKCTSLKASGDTGQSGGGPSILTTSCTHNQDWVCTVPLSASAQNPASAQWVASAQVVNLSATAVTFSPSHGTLAPGATVNVTVTITGAVCPGASTTLYFNTGGQVSFDSVLVWDCGH